MSTIEERVKKIVVEQLGVKEDEVTNSASFVDDLGADSLDTVELVMALEEEFECEIPDEEAEKITSVQQAIDYVKAHVKESSRASVTHCRGRILRPRAFTNRELDTCRNVASRSPGWGSSRRSATTCAAAGTESSTGAPAS